MQQWEKTLTFQTAFGLLQLRHGPAELQIDDVSFIDDLLSLLVFESIAAIQQFLRDAVLICADCDLKLKSCQNKNNVNCARERL